MRVFRLGEFCLPHVEWIFVYFLFLHHGRHALILIEGDAVEVTGLALVLGILLCDDLHQPVSWDQRTLSYQFVEEVYGELLLAFAVIVLQVILLPTLALFHEVEQLQHAVIFPYLLKYLLMLEVHLSILLQPSVQVLQLIIQLDLGLDQGPNKHQYELHLILKANLLYLDTAEVLHPLAVHRTLMDAVTQTIDADIRREQDHQIRCQLKRLQYDLIQRWLKISYSDVLITRKMKLGELWLREHHINALPIHTQKAILIEFYIGIHLIHLSIIQQKPHFLLIFLTGDHLLAGVHIGQFYGVAADACKRIEDDLRAIALVGNVLGDLFRRVYGP